MLYNDRTDVSVGTDVNETSVIFVTIDFVTKGFKFQPYVCNES